MGKLKKHCLPLSEAPQLVTKLLEDVKSADQEAQAKGLNIQPRKANWDLKRDVGNKLDKLRKRTERAILELVREKLISQGGEGANLSRGVMNERGSKTEE